MLHLKRLYIRFKFSQLTPLSQQDHIRYSRHYNLPGFGVEVQQKLKNAKVLVVGAGGLGAPMLLYLAAAGVGTIGIVDEDIVEISNLQRQVIYEDQHLDKRKAHIAAARIKAINPTIDVKVYQNYLTSENAIDIINQFDVVADGTDNFPTRYLVNDACVICQKPNIYASIYQYEGQVAVFNLPNEDGSRSPHYRDIFPEPPQNGLIPDCASGGVLGVLAGIIGSMQAQEVIKVITGIGKPLSSQLLIYDSLSSESRIIKLQKKSHTEVSSLVNYQDFCGVNTISNQKSVEMKEITVQELDQWKKDGKDFQLVDVREQHEIDFVNIGGDNIPLGDIMSRTEEIADEKDVVLMCRSGQRSAAALNALQQQGKENLYNLKGGILAWAKEIDTDLPTY